MNIHEAGYNHSQPWPLSPDLRRVRESTSSSHYINAISCWQRRWFWKSWSRHYNLLGSCWVCKFTERSWREASACLTLCKQFHPGGRRSDWLIIIRMKVLRTDLHIIPSGISSRENLIKDQSIFPLVIMIILLFLITFSFNNVLLLSGENWYWQSWNLKG